MGHSNWVVGLSAAPGCLLSCSNDHTVRTWDLQSKSSSATFSEQRYEVYSVCSLGKGRFAAAGAQKVLLFYGGAEHEPKEHSVQAELKAGLELC